MFSTHRGKWMPLKAADLRSMVVPVIIMLLYVSGAAAEDAKDVPHISDIRLIRKMGEYDLALRYLNTLLTDGSVPESTRRQAYNELVTIAYVTEGAYIARPIAQEALMKFPDLEADPNHHPAAIQEIYQSLKDTMFGRLNVTSYPDRCKVHLDGEEIGYTPIADVYVPAGEHTVRVSAFGFADQTRSINVDPGVVSEQFVEMRRYRAVSKKTMGLELGLSLASLKYDDPTQNGKLFAGVAEVKNYKNVIRLGGGIFFHLFRRDRFALQLGLRYTRHGNRASYDLGDGSGWEEYTSYFHYMAAPVLLKYYPKFKPGLYGFAGPEFAYLISASLSRIKDGKPLAIMQNLQRRQMSLVIGLGMEIDAGRQTIMISASYNMGGLSLRDTGKLGNVDFKPRDFRITVGLLFKEQTMEDAPPEN